MTQQTRSALKELQRLDLRLAAARKRIADFDPLFAEVEEPALMLESELNTTRTRLQEMKLEERRLELATEEKRVRLKRLEERLGSVRNLREEAAVTAESDMVKRALQSDEQEAYTLLDQIRKLESRLSEVEEAFEEAKELVGPRVAELQGQRSEAREELERLQAERESFAAGLDEQELRLYEGIRAGGRTLAVAELTPDGACGHCFGIVPLQVQNEIRHGTALLRCEGCGVILSAPDPDAPASAPDAGPEEAVAPDAESVEAVAEPDAEAAEAVAEPEAEPVTEPTEAAVEAPEEGLPDAAADPSGPTG